MTKPSTENRLPPGPRGALWQTIRYVRNPLKFYLQLIRRFGDTVTVPTVLGKVVVISHPEDIRALFALPPDDFEGWSTDAVAPLFGSSSVLLSSGELYKRQRKMMAAAFQRERIYSCTGSVIAHTLMHIENWPKKNIFRLQDKLSELLADVILTIVMGITDPQKLKRLRHAVLTTGAAIGPVLMFAKSFNKFFPAFGPYARFVRARSELDELIYAEIDEAKSGLTGKSDSILEALLTARDEEGRSFSKEELRDQLVTLIFAGHETSAIALTWALYWLQRYPEMQQKLKEELSPIQITDAQTLSRLPYLDAVCREALRLYPTVPEVIRKLKVPLKLRHYVLPAGMPVAACITATHHRDDLYKNPDRFDPERFLNQRYAVQEYFPFGGGVNRCIGELFAWLEIKLILAIVISRYQITLAGTKPSKPTLRSLTMEPHDGVPVTIQAL